MFKTTVSTTYKNKMNDNPEFDIFKNECEIKKNGIKAREINTLESVDVDLICLVC